MKEYIQTTEPGFYRNKDTGMIINKNKTELDLYNARIEESLNTKKLEKQVNSLSLELKDMKRILEELIKDR